MMKLSVQYSLSRGSASTQFELCRGSKSQFYGPNKTSLAFHWVRLAEALAETAQILADKTNLNGNRTENGSRERHNVVVLCRIRSTAAGWSPVQGGPSS